MKRLTHEADFGFSEWEQTLFEVKSDPGGAYNIIDIAKHSDDPEFRGILIKIALRLKHLEDTFSTFENIPKEILKELLNSLELLASMVDIADDCINAIEDDLDRGNDNDWVRERIEKWHEVYSNRKMTIHCKNLIKTILDSVV